MNAYMYTYMHIPLLNAGCQRAAPGTYVHDVCVCVRVRVCVYICIQYIHITYMYTHLRRLSLRGPRRSWCLFLRELYSGRGGVGVGDELGVEQQNRSAELVLVLHTCIYLSIYLSLSI